MTIQGKNLIALMTGGALFSNEFEVMASYSLESPASVIASYLVGQNAMTAPSENGLWPLFISSRPELPDELGVVYDTTPVKDMRSMSTNAISQHHGIQVSIRARTEKIGRVKCETIAVLLDNVHNVTIIKNGDTYVLHTVPRVGGINSLGYEQGTKRRRLFTMNFLTTISKL